MESPKSFLLVMGAILLFVVVWWFITLPDTCEEAVRYSFRTKQTDLNKAFLEYVEYMNETCGKH